MAVIYSPINPIVFKYQKSKKILNGKIRNINNLFCFERKKIKKPKSKRSKISIEEIISNR